jgi:hypothetical protein
LYEPSKIKNGVFAPQEKPRLRSLSKIETPRAVQIPFPQQKLNIFEFESIFHEIDKCGLKLPINRHFSTQFHLLVG